MSYLDMSCVVNFVCMLKNKLVYIKRFQVSLNMSYLNMSCLKKVNGFHAPISLFLFSSIGSTVLYITLKTFQHVDLNLKETIPLVFNFDVKNL